MYWCRSLWEPELWGPRLGGDPVPVVSAVGAECLFQASQVPFKTICSTLGYEILFILKSPCVCDTHAKDCCYACIRNGRRAKSQYKQYTALAGPGVSRHSSSFPKSNTYSVVMCDSHTCAQTPETQSYISVSSHTAECTEWEWLCGEAVMWLTDWLDGVHWSSDGKGRTREMAEMHK